MSLTLIIQLFVTHFFSPLKTPQTTHTLNTNQEPKQNPCGTLESELLGLGIIQKSFKLKLLSVKLEN